MTDHPLYQLTRARFFEFARRPGSVFWVFGFPILMALGLGMAFRDKPPEIVKAAVSRALPDADEVAKLLEVADRIDVEVLSAQDAAEALRRGRVDLVVDAGSDTRFAYRFDPDHPEARAARLEVDHALQSALGRADAATVSDVRVIERGRRYVDWLIPGLIGLSLMGSVLWGIGFAVVIARNDKLLKRFAVTPMNRGHFLFAFFASRLVFLTLQVSALVLIAWLVFDVTVQGSPLNLAIIAATGAFAFGGIGVLIAARPRSMEAAQGWMNFAQLPMWMLSGCFFSYERFPETVHPFLRALPLTALNDALRHVINEGAPLAASLTELLVLLAWALLTFPLALRIFRWQ